MDFFFGFSDRREAWQVNNLELKKQVRELRSEHDKQEKMATNYMGVTIIAAMKQLEKENPGRTKEVNQAEDREQARRVAKQLENTKEQQAGKGKGHDQGIGD